MPVGIPHARPINYYPPLQAPLQAVSDIQVPADPIEGASGRGSVADYANAYRNPFSFNGKDPTKEKVVAGIRAGSQGEPTPNRKTDDPKYPTDIETGIKTLEFETDPLCIRRAKPLTFGSLLDM
jgi:hypothetical protein